MKSKLIEKLSSLTEFANGGAQVTIKLNNGNIYKEALLSDATAIIAMRGYNDLPFSVSEISEIYQTDDDKNPKQRGNWEFWDEWNN